MAIAKLLVFSSIFRMAFGDPNDWVSVDYVVSKRQTSGGDSTTSDAEKAIVLFANKYANQGPSSKRGIYPFRSEELKNSGIVNAKGILPPSGNSHDYLSWAPYHWPDCNWCPSGKTHLAHTVDGSNNENDNPSPSSTGVSFSYSLDDPYQYFVQSKSILRRQDNTQGIINILPHFPTPVPSVVFSVPGELKTLFPGASTTTVGPAQAAAKTTKSPCTPSPTRPMAPSATWTVCPYVVRDGQVNPDVRTLHGPDAINTLSQELLYIAIAYALRNEPSISETFATFVETFFVNESTKMNPNVDFGQVVRGPGAAGSMGTFTGVLDLRGLVKVTNAVLIIKSTNSPHWTSDLASSLTSWTGEYLNWLLSSSIGRTAASRPNNHGTFYVSQEASFLLLADDKVAAISSLQRYFNNQFLDQIAASGEQPFEAVRTRPYHYCLFNLEAMITNAKLGDQLGLNFWTAKSKYGATIQTALDYAMSRDPKDEDVSQIFPHIAAVAAAYGDPTGKYMAYLKQHVPNYTAKSYWFYDQPSALTNAPTSRSRRSVTWQREDALEPPRSPVAPVQSSVPFECPAVFDKVKEVEIDDGIYVTCEQLKPFYLGGMHLDT